MNISHNKYDATENIIFNEGLKITSLEISPENDKLFIHLNTPFIFVTPVKNYSGLKNASVKHLKNYSLVGSGVGIHWPDLDKDLSLKGFLKEFLSQRVKTKRKMVIA